jgi:hypothetical protein
MASCFFGLWWFSPGTPASSTIKTGRHDIAEILLKVALNTKNQIKSNHLLRGSGGYEDLINIICTFNGKTCSY